MRDCEICGFPDTRQRFHISRGMVFQCRSCGTFRANINNLTRNYTSEFYSTVEESAYIEYFEPFRKGQYRYVLEGLNGEKGGTLLDIGASFGWLVEIAVDLGFDAYGIEPGTIRHGRKLADRIDRLPLDAYSQVSDRKFQVVIMWHVLEHMQSPLEALQDVHRLLADEGILVIAVPNTAGTMFRVAELLVKVFGWQRLMNELWYTHNPNMHHFYYGSGSLCTLLLRTGYRPTRTFTMDAFDWRTIWRRAKWPLTKTCLRMVGPLLDGSGFTRTENLIVVSQKVT